MKGARDYSKFLSRGETVHGPLKIILGEHARGKTLHIYITTDQGEAEVYGVVGGQPGWTESYGWLHKGPWQEDFYRYIESRRLEFEEAQRRQTVTTKEIVDREKRRVEAVLSAYKSPDCIGGES